MKNNLNKYRRIKELGSGGQGNVFLVQDEVGKKYALKVYNQNITRTEIEREIVLLQQLENPNIVTMSDFGQLEGGQVYTIMQYFSQGSLADVEKKRHLSIKDKLTIYKDVAKALRYLHKEGVIHRDIKPENIFVKKIHNSYQGYLGDFGLAKHTEDSMLTRSLHGTMGTALYLSPEVLLNEEKLSSHSDIYALGVSLYKSLTGEFPHGATIANLIEYLQDPYNAPELSEYLKNVPEELQLLIDRSIHYEKKERIKSLNEYIKSIDVIQKKYDTNLIEKIDIVHEEKKNLLMAHGVSFLLGLSLLGTLYFQPIRSYVSEMINQKEVQEEANIIISKEELEIKDDKVIEKEFIELERIDWKEKKGLRDDETIKKLRLRIEETVVSQEILNQQLVDEIYHGTILVKPQVETYNDEVNYEQALSGAIFLKLYNSSFNIDEIEDYWHYPSSNFFTPDNKVLVSQYSFLEGFGGNSEQAQYIRNLGKFMQRYVQDNNSYENIREALEVHNKVSMKELKNILYEIKSDIFFYSAVKMGVNHSRIIDRLGELYYKKISENNIYLIPSKDNTNGLHYYGLTRREYIDEFTKLLNIDAIKFNKNQGLHIIQKFKSDNKNFIEKAFKELDYSSLKNYIETFEEIRYNANVRHSLFNNLFTLEELNFSLRNAHLLYMEAYKQIQNIDGVESKRLEKKKSKILYEVIKMADKNSKIKLFKDLVQVHRNLLENYSNYDVEHFRLANTVYDLGIGEAYTKFDNIYFDRFLPKMISTRRDIFRLEPMRKWFKAQIKHKQYGNIIHYSRGNLITCNKDDFLQEGTDIEIMLQIMNAYYYGGYYSQGFQYINNKVTFDKVITKFDRFLEKPSLIKGISESEIVRYLGMMAKFYRKNKQEAYFEDVEKLYLAKVKYMVKTEGKIDRVEAARYNNVLQMSLDIQHCYLEYLTKYKTGKELLESLNNIKGVRSVLNSDVAGKKKLYTKLIESYTLYFKLYENYDKQAPSKIVKEMKSILHNDDLLKLCDHDSEIKKSYIKLQRLYLSNTRR